MLRYQDGFDHQEDDADIIAQKGPTGNDGSNSFAASSGTNSPGAYSYGSSLKVYNNTHWKNFDSQTTWILGFHIKKAAAGDGYILRFKDSAIIQCSLKYESNYLKFYRGDTDTLLGTSSNTFDLTTGWYWIDLKIVINNSTGSVLLKVDGATEIDLSSQDTQMSGNASADIVGLSSPNGVYTYFDNLYIADGQAGEVTDILGECRIYTQKGNADGAVNQFTPLSGDNYTNIDEETHDSDTTYNYSSTIGHQDLYALEDFSGVGAIKGVQVTNAIRKDDGGVRKIKDLIRLGTTIYKGDEQTILSGYRFYTKLYEENPDTSVVFVDADIDAAQSGIEMTT